MVGPEHNFLLPTILVLASVLLIVGMKYAAGVWQARLRFANEDSFRSLAARATSTQSAMATSLATTEAELADVRTRLAAIEKMLRDVG